MESKRLNQPIESQMSQSFCSLTEVFNDYAKINFENIGSSRCSGSEVGTTSSVSWLPSELDQKKIQHLNIKEAESVRHSVNMFDNEVIYEASEPLEDGDGVAGEPTPRQLKVRQSLEHARSSPSSMLNFRTTQSQLRSFHNKEDFMQGQSSSPFLKERVQKKVTFNENLFMQHQNQLMSYALQQNDNDLDSLIKSSQWNSLRTKPAFKPSRKARGAQIDKVYSEQPNDTYLFPNNDYLHSQIMSKRNEKIERTTKFRRSQPDWPQSLFTKQKRNSSNYVTGSKENTLKRSIEVNMNQNQTLSPSEKVDTERSQMKDDSLSQFNQSSIMNNSSIHDVRNHIFNCLKPKTSEPTTKQSRSCKTAEGRRKATIPVGQDSMKPNASKSGQRLASTGVQNPSPVQMNINNNYNINNVFYQNEGKN